MKTHNQSTPGRTLLHTAAIILFIAAACFVCLFSAGILTLRLPWKDHSSPEATKTPGELAYESYLASLETERSPGTSATRPETSARPDDTTSPATDPVEYPSLAELLSQGYNITYSDYDTGMKLARITLQNGDLPLSLYLGSTKTVTVLVPTTLEEGGQLYESYEEHPEPRKAVELYMGYILIDNNDGTVSVYRSDGSFIETFDASDVVPAYARDSSDNPLFIKNGSYFYLDETTKTFASVEFDPKYDGRGLFFDYDPAYGKSESENLQVLWRTEPVTLTYTLDRSSYYTRFKVDPRIARALYELDPVFAEKVAIQQPGGHYYNYPFKLALDKAKEDIAREQADAATATEPETEPLPEPTTEPETEPVPEPTTEPESEPATEPEPITEPETTPATEPVIPPEDITPPAEPLLSPSELPDTGTAETGSTEPEASYPSVTEPAVSEPESTEAETSEPETLPPEETTEEVYDPMIEVSATFEWPRYYYGTYPDIIRMGVGYARAYAFSEGYACIVNDYGVLKVINTSGRITANLRYEYRTDAGNGYTYMVRTYYQPFYNDIYHLGYLYFDHGLMRVRVLEHELNEGDVVNYITGDYDILIDAYGNEYELPAGYRLVSYSDGVLLLERDGRYGYYHRDGYWIAQPVYTYAMPFVEGIGVIGYKDGVKGALDTTGNTVIPFEYEEISTASSGIFACFAEDSGWTLLAKVKLN